MAFKVGLGNQELLCKLGDLIIIRGENSLEGIVYQRNAVPSGNQVPKAKGTLNAQPASRRMKKEPRNKQERKTKKRQETYQFLTSRRSKQGRD